MFECSTWITLSPTSNNLSTPRKKNLTLSNVGNGKSTILIYISHFYIEFFHKIIPPLVHSHTIGILNYLKTSLITTHNFFHEHICIGMSCRSYNVEIVQCKIIILQFASRQTIDVDLRTLDGSNPFRSPFNWDIMIFLFSNQH